MVELSMAPRRYTPSMRLQLVLSVVLVVGGLVAMYVVYAPVEFDEISPTKLVLPFLVLLLIPFVYVTVMKSRLHITRDTIVHTSGLPAVFKNRHTDWRLKRDEIKSIEVITRDPRQPIGYHVRFATAGGDRTLAVFSWFRNDRDPEDPIKGFVVSVRPAMMLERARTAGVVTALEENGYPVSFPEVPKTVDALAQSKAGWAVAIVAIIAALLAVFESAIQPYAYLAGPPWILIAMVGIAVAVVGSRLLAGVENASRGEKWAAPIVLGACVSLLVWAGAPRVNAMSAQTDADWQYQYVGDGVFSAFPPGPPDLDLGEARRLANQAGWTRGDFITVPVIYGSLGFWQYNRRDVHPMIQRGPAD